MNAARPLTALPAWEFRYCEQLGPSVWAPGHGLVACTNTRREEDFVNMRRIAALPKVLEELRATSSCLQAACLIMDAESRKLAMERVAQARMAIAMASGCDS